MITPVEHKAAAVSRNDLEQTDCTARLVRGRLRIPDRSKALTVSGNTTRHARERMLHVQITKAKRRPRYYSSYIAWFSNHYTTMVYTH